MTRRPRPFLRCLLAPTTALGLATALVAPAGAAVAAAPAAPTTASPPKQAIAEGSGGAVSSIDPYATQVGLDVLASGGNAADAAVATAAALGVTEPYSGGIGGGGYLVYYDARAHRVRTLDSREAAPASFTETSLTDGAGNDLGFDDVVNSGLSVGVPGTPELWATAARRFGTRSLSQLLRPAEQLARDGFVVDDTYASQTAANADRFRRFPETARVFLPGGQVPAVGSTFRNPDLARTYDLLRRSGVDALYDGPLGTALVDAAQHPATAPGASAYAGKITTDDLRAYSVISKRPVRSEFAGLEVDGMAPSSSGGTTVAEILNLLESYDARTGTTLRDLDQVDYLHRFAEAGATAWADRNRWVADVPGVPVRQLVDQRYADERACALFDPERAAPRPLPPGQPDGSYDGCTTPLAAQPALRDEHGTTHLTVADRWGNVASYTLTLEEIGGSGITVPGYGVLLNNELTDFDFSPIVEGQPDPNLPGPGKRPRSSMSPTIVLDHGRPVLALGSPGGARIVTTVAQVVAGYAGRGLSLPDAVTAPRLSSRNGSSEQAEPGIADGPLGVALRARGHVLTSTPEIGVVAAIRMLPGGRFQAVAEPTRRGGGASAVVDPR